MSRIPRIFVDQDLDEDLDVRLDGQALKHLVRVLRLQPGAPVRVFDGRSHEYAANLVSGDTGFFLRLAEPVPPLSEPPLPICLVQGISRGERMDLVIQKATELGVTEIRPVMTQRSVVRLDQRRRQHRLDHWRGIAVAACEQCGRARLPIVHAPTDLEPALDALPAETTRLVLDPEGGAPSPGSAPRDGGLVLLVGPEGGLNGKERQQILARGFAPLALGPRIMRTETAAIAAVIVAQTLWGDFSASP